MVGELLGLGGGFGSLGLALLGDGLGELLDAQRTVG